MIRTLVPVVFAVAATASMASAEPTSTSTATSTDYDNPHSPNAGKRIAVFTPTAAYAVQGATVSPTLYLERCIGGCLVHGGGVNDARIMTSTIPNPGDYQVTEFHNAAHVGGTAADAEWAMFVTCMKEVYSPFLVTVTDVKPPAGVSYHLALVAGTPGELQLTGGILGVAPLAGNCAAFDNVISFTFANSHTETDPVDRTMNLCWTAAQESAHAYGLDHEFAFLSSGQSACSDPMTYRFECGGEKFFRNEPASCGEFVQDGARPCRCGASQNSHLKILSVFGEGTPITGVPTVAVTTPAASSTGADTLPANVIAQASDKRGVAKVELYLNGFKWAEAKGAPFGQMGQPPSSYGLLVPGNAPPSIYDVVARAYDDLGAFTDSAPVTVTKGPFGGCVTADSCAKGQQCSAGKCFWDAPAGEIGDNCTFPQFCKSGVCQGTADQTICTQSCIPGVADSCPADSGLVCRDTGQPGQGICFFDTAGGGCCSASSSSAPWTYFGIAALLGLVVLGRRRRS